MTSEEKLQDVHDQLLAIERGDSVSFECPYCFGETQMGAEFCCATLQKAVTALVTSQDANIALAMAEEIIGNVH